MLAGEPLFLWAVETVFPSPRCSGGGVGEGRLHVQGVGVGGHPWAWPRGNSPLGTGQGGKEHMWLKHGHLVGKEAPARDKSSRTLDSLA